MSTINRRDFLAATACAATCLAGGERTANAAPTPPHAPQVPLGKTGITMSRLGQGTGTRGGNRQSDQTRMGFDRLVALYRHAFDRGITFFDLADLYGSHVYLREALRFIPRAEVTILTKLWWRYDDPAPASSDAARKKSAHTALERFRHEMATDYLDIVLLHCMSTGTWDRELGPYMDALSEAKERKQVRAVGVSCHDLGALQTAAGSPWVDVVLARINPYGVKMDGTRDEIVQILRQIKQNGKALIGMKIYGEGKLVDRREECIRYAQDLGVLDAMTIGFDTAAQIDETLTLMAKYPAASVG